MIDISSLPKETMDLLESYEKDNFKDVRKKIREKIIEKLLLKEIIQGLVDQEVKRVTEEHNKNRAMLLSIIKEMKGNLDKAIGNIETDIVEEIIQGILDQIKSQGVQLNQGEKKVA